MGLDFSDGDDVWPGGVEATAVVNDVGSPSDKAGEEPAADDGRGPSQQADPTDCLVAVVSLQGIRVDEACAVVLVEAPLCSLSIAMRQMRRRRRMHLGRVSNPQSPVLSDSSGWRRKKRHPPEPQEIESTGAGEFVTRAKPEVLGIRSMHL